MAQSLQAIITQSFGTLPDMPTIHLRLCSLTTKICLNAYLAICSILICAPLAAQEAEGNAFEYKVPASQATVSVEFVTFGSGHITANVTMRKANVEKTIIAIEANLSSLDGRKITLPSIKNSTQNSMQKGRPPELEKPYTTEGKMSDSLARGGLPSRYLLVSVPETAELDRLVMIDLQAAEADLDGRREFRAQEILVPKENSNIQRIFSVKTVAPVDREKPSARGSVGGTMLSIADVDKDGKIATFGTGLVVHQMFFLMDKDFINLSQAANPFGLKNDHSYEIIDKTTGTTVYRSLGIHHTPRYLPTFTVREGRIDQASRFGGPIHPQIVEVIGRQGSNGILALPYLPLQSRDSQPIANLFDSFQPEYRADLTIEQASLVPKIEISNRESVEKIREAILTKSEVAVESATSRKGLRVRQERGLKVLQNLSSEFPPALEALKAIAISFEADATLRSMAKTAAHEAEREIKRSPKSRKAYIEIVDRVLDSSGCVRAFVPVTFN